MEKDKHWSVREYRKRDKVKRRREGDTVVA